MACHISWSGRERASTPAPIGNFIRARCCSPVHALGTPVRAGSRILNASLSKPTCQESKATPILRASDMSQIRQIQAPARVASTPQLVPISTPSTVRGEEQPNAPGNWAAPTSLELITPLVAAPRQSLAAYCGWHIQQRLLLAASPFVTTISDKYSQIILVPPPGQFPLNERSHGGRQRPPSTANQDLAGGELVRIAR